MRALLAVAAGVVAAILTLVVVSIVNQVAGVVVPLSGLLALAVGVVVAISWYYRGWYPNRTV